MTYVHGYDSLESARLQDQAATLVELLHGDTHYGAGSLVLEAGCGVGAQTVTLVAQSPGAHIISVDISRASIEEARSRLSGTVPVAFTQADIFHLPFTDNTFDHVFICFVLEHLADPRAALHALRSLLKRGGSLTVIEGDHGSTFFHPDSAAAHAAIQSLVTLQLKHGGNALIGRQLYPLLVEAGFLDVHVSPRMVYVDWSRPRFVEGFTKKTFAAMVEGVRSDAIAAGLIDAAVFDQGVRDLYRAAEDDGVFCYTFFKAVCIKR